MEGQKCLLAHALCNCLCGCLCGCEMCSCSTSSSTDEQARVVTGRNQDQKCTTERPHLVSNEFAGFTCRNKCAAQVSEKTRIQGRFCMRGCGFQCKLYDISLSMLLLTAGMHFSALASNDDFRDKNDLNHRDEFFCPVMTVRSSWNHGHDMM
jgi:hypothetical protein